MKQCLTASLGNQIYAACEDCGHVLAMHTFPDKYCGLCEILEKLETTSCHCCDHN